MCIISLLLFFFSLTIFLSVLDNVSIDSYTYLSKFSNCLAIGTQQNGLKQQSDN